MSLILCATRGGEASIPTQIKAINLAKKEDSALTFLYVADSSFLNKTAAAVVVDVDEELTNMGEFLLVMAVERAAERGVTAESIIRAGVIREVLPDVARTLGASMIVLGRPAGESSRFQESEFLKVPRVAPGRNRCSRHHARRTFRKINAQRIRCASLDNPSWQVTAALWESPHSRAVRPPLKSNAQNLAHLQAFPQPRHHNASV